MVVLGIVALLMAFAIPSSSRFYYSMQYQRSVHDVVTMLASARRLAVSTGKAQDVVINPQTNEFRLNEQQKELPSELEIAVHSAREVNLENSGVIRFYPEGGSSGGAVDIVRSGRGGVRVSIDWLIGTIRQEKYATNE